MDNQYWVAFSILSIGMFLYLVIDSWYSDVSVRCKVNTILFLMITSVIFASVILLLIMSTLTLGDKL